MFLLTMEFVKRIVMYVLQQLNVKHVVVPESITKENV